MLLDSNVWRYVHDVSANGKLIKLARNGSFDILLAPAVVYEALRLKNIAVRDALIRLMTTSGFKRLMPEAYSESMEFLAEVERVRPEWLRREPDLAFFKRLRNDWWKTTGGFWVRVARSPGKEAGYLGPSEETMIENAQAQSRNARREIMDADWKVNKAMDKTMSQFMVPVPGWRGDEFQMWRGDALTSKTYGLSQHAGAYRDWIAPFVDVDNGLLERPEWVEFWIYDVTAAALPRQWLRWAFGFAQRFRKVTDGAPADIQLSTYFVEADIVVSADKALLAILDEVRPFAPCPLPRGVLIAAGANGVEELLSLLGTSFPATEARSAARGWPRAD